MCAQFSLDNASVAALVGAAAAYALVVLNDWRRDRRVAKRVVPSLLKRIRLLIDSRRDGAAEAQRRAFGSPLRNIGARFPVHRIERYSEQSTDHLTQTQLNALDNLIFLMNECDRTNAKASDLVDLIEAAERDVTLGENSSRPSVFSLSGSLDKTCGEEIVLLNRIEAIIAAYLGGQLTERGGPPA